MNNITAGFALCGSFCTFSEVIPQMEKLVHEDYNIIPIMSQTAFATNTRFGNSQDFIDKIEEICNNKIIHKIEEAEPIGPKKLLDILLIAPCTGNTLAKLSCGITDTSVTMAAKAHLRNGRPLVIAPATNDGLAASAANIGALMNKKHVYFVPYSQDDPENKPASTVALFPLISQTLNAAAGGGQLQPVLRQRQGNKQ